MNLGETPEDLFTNLLFMIFFFITMYFFLNLMGDIYVTLEAIRFRTIIY
ncbi:hypothetical protein [Candidatus Absconditicoccus praedator]|nr:hypothetical protein [Candidatus Absconditicoccus praedator]